MAHQTDAERLRLILLGLTSILVVLAIVNRRTSHAPETAEATVNDRRTIDRRSFLQGVPRVLAGGAAAAGIVYTFETGHTGASSVWNRRGEGRPGGEGESIAPNGASQTGTPGSAATAREARRRAKPGGERCSTSMSIKRRRVRRTKLSGVSDVGQVASGVSIVRPDIEVQRGGDDGGWTLRPVRPLVRDGRVAPIDWRRDARRPDRRWGQLGRGAPTVAGDHPRPRNAAGARVRLRQPRPDRVEGPGAGRARRLRGDFCSGRSRVPERRRALYVSTGRDNNERTLVCGVVVAPTDRRRIAVAEVGGRPTGRIAAWAHGALGLVHRCQPSVQPALEIWGEPPYGINTVAWGSEASGDRHVGKPEHGILAGMIDAGWIVAATDYYADLWGEETLLPFIIGKIEAANVIDSVSAAHRLLRRVDDGYDLNAYDVVTWGHSQGGHSALWAGQLLASYTAATATRDGPVLALSGVALEAPGNTFVVQPNEQPATAPGYGLLDWLANARLQLTGVPEPIPVGPFFLSYLFGAWSHYAGRGPADAAAMPAYPDVGPLDLSALVTPAGIDTLGKMTQVCWADGAPVVELAAPYANQAYLVPAVGDGPTIDGARHGNFDVTCAADPRPEMAAWCAWLRYNLPGPLGKHPLDTLPTRDGRLVPIMIAVGSDDGVVHCVTQPAGADAVPSARDCPARSLYDALRTAYCPAGSDRGHLRFDAWTPRPGVTRTDHSDITGLVATASIDEPRFAGSPLQQFMQAAFDGTLAPGCAIGAAPLRSGVRG